MTGSSSWRSALFAKRLQAQTSIVLLALAGGMSPATAAPLPPLPPLNACGTIESHAWLPPRSAAPVAGMSGSASRERHWPGRFVTVLRDLHGVGGREVARINALLVTSSDGAGIRLGPGQLLLVIADDDPARLAGMKSLCVTGFTVSGDEGGTWTRHTGLKTFAGAYPGQK